MSKPPSACATTCRNCSAPSSSRRSARSRRSHPSARANGRSSRLRRLRDVVAKTRLHASPKLVSIVEVGELLIRHSHAEEVAERLPAGSDLAHQEAFGRELALHAGVVL